MFVFGAEWLTPLGSEMLRQDMSGVLCIFCGPAEMMEEAVRASETVERRMLWLEANDLAPAKKGARPKGSNTLFSAMPSQLRFDC